MRSCMLDMMPNGSKHCTCRAESEFKLFDVAGLCNGASPINNKAFELLRLFLIVWQRKVGLGSPALFDQERPVILPRCRLFIFMDSKRHLHAECPPSRMHDHSIAGFETVL